MNESVLYEFQGSRYATYLVRLITFVITILVLINIQSNYLGALILIILCILGFIFSGIQDVLLYENEIKFCTKRLIPVLKKEISISYKDVDRLDFRKREISLAALVLMGSGAVKSSEFIFYFKKGTIKKIPVAGNKKRISEMYTILLNRINDN